MLIACVTAFVINKERLIDYDKQTYQSESNFSRPLARAQDPALISSSARENDFPR
jgi:hypothetical protein